MSLKMNRSNSMMSSRKKLVSERVLVGELDIVLPDVHRRGQFKANTVLPPSFITYYLAQIPSLADALRRRLFGLLINMHVFPFSCGFMNAFP